MIEDSKKSEEIYKKEISELNNNILELKKEKEKNNELTEKNKNLNMTILNIKKNFENIKTEKRFECPCPYENICAKCGYTNNELILFDCCCNCKFKNDCKYLN